MQNVKNYVELISFIIYAFLPQKKGLIHINLRKKKEKKTKHEERKHGINWLKLRFFFFFFC